MNQGLRKKITAIGTYLLVSTVGWNAGKLVTGIDEYFFSTSNERSLESIIKKPINFDTFDSKEERDSKINQ